MGLGVGIWALRLGFGPQDWDLGLEAGIWASRLRYGPGGWGKGGYKGEEEEEGEGGENSPYVGKYMSSTPSGLLPKKGYFHHSRHPNQCMIFVYIGL